ncbi:MAG: DUF2974 domain-containing protein [Lachnospiraceae bacterium]|nr:DUF2974 domain-containing protein [Lachnospiraceae bacterium]
MADVFEYLDWRGDLSIEQIPFNEVDGMLLARLSYAPFEYIGNQIAGKPISIEEAARNLLEIPDIKEKLLLRDDFRLLSALSESERFHDMTLLFYENLTDLETQTQFSAITIRVKHNLYFVSFRGTDNSFVGWKEDFNMSFVFPVPAQKMAVQYLEKIARNTFGRFIVGGHSKGGNLAVYAAAFCDPSIQDRINTIYNYDGPGFSEDVLLTAGYKAICDKITTFIPQSSIVGLLLEHEEKYTIVHSTQAINMMQHNVYSWEVQRNHFVYLETVTNSSKFIDTTLKSWVASMSMEQREKFFDAIYTVLTETNVHSFRELGDNWFFSAISIIKSIKNLDEETRTAVIEMLRSLMQITRSGMLKAIKGK